MNTAVSPSVAIDDTPAPPKPKKPSFLKKIWRSFLSFLKRLGRAIVSLLLLFALVLLIVLIVFWSRIVITIMPGEAGVHYQRFLGGTMADFVYPEGIHLIPPWDYMYIYDVRVNTIQHSFDVLTNRGLPIHLDLAIRYQPEYEMVGVLHQKVGPDYLQKIVIPQSESVLRREIGQHNPEDIYTNKEGILSTIISLALEEMSQKYVNVDDIIIRKMSLPSAVKSAIEQKLVYEQQEKSYDFLLEKEQREAQRKEIEASGIREYQRIVKETLDDKLLTWQGINATLSLAESNNTKVVVIGSGENGLPIILGGDYTRETLTPHLNQDNTPNVNTNNELTSNSNLGIGRSPQNLSPEQAENMDSLMKLPPPSALSPISPISPRSYQ